MINNSKKTVLITGGAGFIGLNLTKHLLHLSGYNLRILDNLSEQIHGKNPLGNERLRSVLDKVEFIHGDITNIADIKKSLDNVEIVVHLASETGTGQSMYQISRYVEVNQLGTANLLQAIAENETKIDKFILASSRAVYGEGLYNCKNHGLFIPDSRKEENLLKGKFEIFCDKCNEVAYPEKSSEDINPKPTSIYGINKFNQEQLTLNLCNNMNIDSIVLRLQNVYGPGQSLSNPYTGIISIFTNRIISKKEIFIFEDGKETRDFVYIDDVIDIFSKVITSENIKSYILNVGSGIPTKIIDLVKNLGEAINIKPKILVTGEFRVGDIRHNSADLKKINSLFKNFIFTPLDIGLKKFCEWVKNQQIKEDHYEKSIMELHKKGLLK